MNFIIIIRTPKTMVVFSMKVKGKRIKHRSYSALLVAERFQRNNTAGLSN